MVTLPDTLVAISTTMQQLLASSAPWWDDRTAGWIGAIGGTAIGSWGGIIGTLAGAGRGRRFTLWSMRILVGLGILSVVLGIAALSSGQPYRVYYPLLLGGGITAGVLGSLYRGVRRRFQQIELRKMQAADIS